MMSSPAQSKFLKMSSDDRIQLINKLNHIQPDGHINPDNTQYCYGFEKHDRLKHTGNITGMVLLLNKSDFAIVDIDINTSMSMDERKELADGFIESLPKTRIDRTCGGGLHIWAKWDHTGNFTTNQNQKVYKCDDFDIDIFVPVKPNARQFIVLPGTTAKSHDGNIGTCECVQYCDYDDMISFKDLLKFLKEEFDITFKQTETETVDAELNDEEEILKEVEAEREEEEEKEDIDVDDIDAYTKPEKPHTRFDDVKKVSNVDKNRNYEGVPMTKELFDKLVKGFEGLEVHNDATGLDKNEISLFPLITALNACEKDDEVDRDDIVMALMKLKKKCKLTDNARKNFDSKIKAYKNKKADHFGYLIKALKQFKPDYYKQVIKSYIPHNASSQELFETTPYTFDEYLMDMDKFEYLDDHINALRKCIAINTRGGFLVKDYDTKMKWYNFTPTTRTMLKERASIIFTYKLTEKQMNEKLEQQRKNHRKLDASPEESISLIKLLERTTFTRSLAKYMGVELMSNNPLTLQLWHPPKGSYDRQLAIDFIDFMKTRVLNEKPLMEEFYSHAYRFRHPEVFIEKFFIHFEEGGHAGKSFLPACLAKMYGRDFYNIAVDSNQLTKDDKNAWQERMLLLWAEEVQNDKYRNEDMEKTIKLMITPEGSFRDMYKTAKSGEKHFIAGMNSNKPDLYGLIRADDATITRLVIVEYKPNPKRDIPWAKYVKKFLQDPNFGYSLYKYLAEEIEIPDDFDPCRYYSQEKYDYINKAKGTSKNTLEAWMDSLFNGRGDYDSDLRVTTWDKKEYYYITIPAMNRSYKQFHAEQGWGPQFKSDSLTKEFVKLGFEKKKTNIPGQRGVELLRVLKDKFDEEHPYDDSDWIEEPDN